jgi:hypothetical protein
VSEGARLASRAGARPATDQLAVTFEALSLASRHPETPGRLTKPLTPAGFEALGGVSVKAAASRPTAIVASRASQAASKEAAAARERQAAAGARERQAEVERHRQAALEKAQAAALRKAEAEVERARSAEVFARKKWEQAKRDLESAERALRKLQ